MCCTETGVLISAPRADKRHKCSLRLEKNFDARRVSIYMVHIGRIYSVIRTQNKAEVSIYLMLNVNCGVKIVM